MGVAMHMCVVEGESKLTTMESLVYFKRLPHVIPHDKWLSTAPLLSARGCQ